MAVTYKESGVDIDAGDELVERIKPLANSTRIAEVVDGVGGFAGLCALPADIASSTMLLEDSRGEHSTTMSMRW